MQAVFFVPGAAKSHRIFLFYDARDKISPRSYTTMLGRFCCVSILKSNVFFERVLFPPLLEEDAFVFF